MGFWNNIFHVGVHDGLTFQQSREVTTINSINFGGISIISTLMIINLFAGNYVAATVEFIAILFGALPVFYFNIKRKYAYAKNALFTYSTISCLIITLYAIYNRRNVNTEFILYAIALTSIMYFDGKKKNIAFISIALSYWIAIFFKFMHLRHKTEFDFIFETINAAATYSFTYLIATRFKNYYSEYEQNIIEKNTELTKLNQQKDKLFSIIAHDLRSPLSSLNQILSMLSEGNLTKEEFDELIKKISKNSGYTSEVLDNLLHWTSSQLKEFKINKVKFDIEEVIEEKINFAQPLLSAKNIAVLNSVSEKTLVFADIDMIKIVLRNLLSNAIKFSEHNKKIIIKAYTENNHIAIAVIDEGVGISDNEQKIMFNNISYTKPGTANEKGTGIGLPLCKEFVEKNGGTISVKSQLNKGSTFTFTLPAA